MFFFPRACIPLKNSIVLNIRVEFLLRTVMSTLSRHSSAIKASVFRGLSGRYILSKLAWEFSSLDGISGRIARGHLAELCRNLRFFLTRSQEVVRNGSAVGSEVREGIRDGIHTTRNVYVRMDGRADGRTDGRTDGPTLRRPFRSLKQPVKVSGMRFLRSQI